MSQINASTIRAEGFSNEPYWWRHAKPSASVVEPLPERADVAVVGSGYAGLCCAIELARAGLVVVVLDALEIGAGASTRAAGFLAGRAGVSKQINLEEAVGLDHANEILEEADAAYQSFQDYLNINAIDCDFQSPGRFVGANSAKAYDKLAGKMAEYNADGLNRFRMIPKSEQGRVVQSEFFHGGMWTDDAGLIHPAKYHAGLVKLCQQLGVKLVGNTRVVGVESDGRFKSVRTDRGSLRVRHAMLGTGGYTDKLSRWHRRRIVPMSSTAIATEALGEQRVSELLPAGAPVIDTKRVINYARPSPDGRHILFGGRARFTPVSSDKSMEILYRQMLEMFPQLEGTKIINSWSGYMAFTFDFLPKVGEHNGLHYAMACNGGSGIVMMSWLGKKAAANILGLEDRSSAFERLEFKTMPLYSGIPWFVPFVGNWYRLRDWVDYKVLQ